ncbi:tryptophan 2,3-dioxygenase [Aeromicrobium chenweiae]|uniref:Tryptophan 2,3-dioxygenase n=1 Tax=Aeromicrobium chenweiae TaxID=2079793 RepID=A0A2S0WJ03_9ACTN|nr:tryptophan 2,3-dioxygenase [Aeromicrobium chenweiae]AWB91319.1 tryptophan 2,3-dioxygenase [Aeromicrobium chenweiae]TGN30554.1 tryptophan 2,3-dioxygenase [Aeromicrobium chenweiae]
MDPTFRPIEDGVATDLRGEMTYAGYLQLPTLLSAQQPVSDHHDEMLFIIQHQVTELWLKQLVHELRSAIALLTEDDLSPALKRLARVKAIQRQMFEQWSVLETLTPVEYVQFRDSLGKASGFQSPQYRTVEFLLGNKNPQMIAVFAHDPDLLAGLQADLEAPSLYDAFLRYLARHGHEVPASVLERDLTQPYAADAGVVEVFRRVYADPQAHWDAYEMCEELVDVEESFQLWRFRHLKTVERIIGFKRGTGGSSGVHFLQKALELTFFPELRDVRTHL